MTAPARGSTGNGTGLFSKTFFLWVHRVLSLSKAKSLSPDDYVSLPAGCSAAEQVASFQAAHHADALATKTVWKILRRDFYKALTVSCLSSVAKIGTVMLVRSFSQFLIDRNESIVRGFIYAGGLFLLTILEAILVPQANLLMSLCTIKLANIFSSVAYRKAKSLHPFVRDRHKRGDIVNLALNDCSRIVDSSVFLVVGCSAPVLLLVSLAAAIFIIGPSAVIILLWTIIITLVMQKMGMRQGTQVKAKLSLQGKRISIINEMLQSMRVVKLSAWEEFFQGIISRVRSQEERALLRWRVLQAITNPTCIALTPLSCLSTVGIYLALHGELPSIPDTFALINILRNISVPMTLLGTVFGIVFSLLGNLKRLDQLMAEREFDPSQVLDSDPPKGDLDVQVQNGCYAWSEGVTALKNINLDVQPGQLVFVVGHLGQGKSSLLQSILGEMEAVQESKSPPCAIDRSGNLAYAPQQPVVMNMTLRDNVVFKQAFDDERFQSALHAAALYTDLEMLPAGDMTEIGEKGVTLSGGQRARVGLARVAYAQPKIALLDDPFAALDMEVGRHVFEHLVCGTLSGATRLVVSSQVHMLDDPRIDRVIVVKDGCIAEDGTFTELCRGDKELQQLLQFAAPSAAREQSKTAAAAPAVEVSSKAATATPASRLSSRITTDERKEEGSIKLATLVMYLRSIGFGRVFLSLFLIFLYNLSEYAPDLWLSAWQENLLNASNEFYLGWWVGIICIGLCFMYASRIYGTFVTARAATKIHNEVLSSILRCTMTFFEQTPSGRIMNRFGQDQFILDVQLGIYLEALWMIIFKCANTCIVIVLSAPWVAVSLVALLPPLLLLTRMMRPAMRDTQRYALITRSLPFNCMEETLTGLAVIRASGVEEEFTSQFHSSVDSSMAWLFTKAAITCWGEQRVMLLSAAVVAASAVCLVILRDSVLPSVASIGLVYVVILAETARFIFTIGTQAESALASVERSQEFIDAPHEAPRSIVTDSSVAIQGRGADVVFKDVVLRYQAHLEPALNNVSFAIAAGERVGIVGRSGSGKSTLLVTLVRIVEPCSGQILIGPHDALKVGLRFLRSLVTVIPQEPVMFSGSLRWNLDPKETCSEDELKEACKSTGLLQVRPDLSLDDAVSEGGVNFSVGERQLVCMARALLRRNPVMLFDEATANIDVENDARLQRVLRDDFRGATLLTVAHRLHTIKDSDRILTMSNGKVAEFDTPLALLESNGTFAALAREAGITKSELCAEDAKITMSL
eukprot:TRINITY_DN105681_c0_g1_i1.p1 TRINITY_DN105681_c0_g1~~TRINITY_DN105681_c0_g1_i1.p1  ORF type:complete len:1256 (+),score=180.53 TRINITY_DN105681_c0_g1_i1:27-3794(+)